MHKSAGRPGMRTPKSEKGRPWYRIENAFVDEENSDRNTTPVYIYDEIGDSWWGDSTSAANFIKQIGMIATPNIELHLNSPGGDIFDGVAIYNALRAHNAKITVIVDALAASAASFIAQAGDEVIMTKAATMMIHDGAAMVWGTAADMRSTADLLDKLSNTVAEIYSDRAGESIEFFRELMMEETWYNAHEAVEVGLADKIGEDTKKEDDEEAQNKWDMSVFNYAGREAAPNPFQVRQRIANRLKEATVTAKVTNTAETPEGEPTGEPEGTPQTVNPESPEVNPDAQTTEGTAGEVDEEKEEQQAPAVSDPGNTASGGNMTVTFGADQGVTFTINGAPVTDPKQVQNHVKMLEDFRDETLKDAKRQFVQTLARDNKIMASQIDKLTEYALSITDDAQYVAWRDTWEGSAPHNMMSAGKGVDGVTNPDGNPPEESTEIDKCKGVVRQHQLSGMKQEAIMETKSYKRLMELDPTFKL